MHQQQSAPPNVAHCKFITLHVPTGLLETLLTMGVEQLLLLPLLLLVSRVTNIAAPIAVAATEVSNAAWCDGVPFFVAAIAARAVVAATRDTDAVAVKLSTVSEVSEKVFCRVLIE